MMDHVIRPTLIIRETPILEVAICKILQLP
jgi:hypothetical protein